MQSVKRKCEVQLSRYESAVATAHTNEMEKKMKSTEKKNNNNSVWVTRTHLHE